MTQVTYTARPIISGMWKFKDSVQLERLAAVARSWSKGKDGANYSDIHIRKCSKDQYGIGFKYSVAHLMTTNEGWEWEHEYKRFFHKMTDQLKRMFGNDFVGWDVSSSTWIIK